MSDTNADRVQQQIQRLPFGAKLLGRREIKELPSLLRDDEEVLDLCQGTYGNGQGLLVATNRRLLFVDKGMLWGLKVEDFPLDKITSIQYHTGMIFGTRTIFASGNKAEIKQVEKASARSFAEGARARLSATVSKPQSTAVDVVSEIERLGQLKEKGLLTEEEFAAGKRRLLGA